MAEFAHQAYENNSVTSTASSTWTGMGVSVIDGDFLEANTKYLIIARCLFGVSSVTNLGYLRVKVSDETAVQTKSEVAYEMADSGSADLHPYMFVHSFTTAATPTDIQFEGKVDGGSTLWVDSQSVVVLNLDNIGTAGTDYFEDIQSASGSEVGVEPSGTTIASIDGADLGTDEHLILGYAKIGIGSGGRYFRARLNTAMDTSTVVNVGWHTAEGEDTVEDRIVGFAGRHKASSGTPNAIINATEEASNGNMTDEGGYMIALPTALFADFEYDFTSGSISVNTEATIASVGPYTPSTGGNHLIFGSARMIGASSADSFLHLEDGTTETRAGEATTNQHQHWDTGKDLEQFNVFQRISFSTSKTYNLRGQQSSSGFWQSRWLIVVNLNEASTGTTYTHDVSESFDVTVADTETQVMDETAEAESFDVTEAASHAQVMDETGLAESFDPTVAHVDSPTFNENVSESFDATEAHTEIQTHVEDVAETFEPTESHTEVQTHVEDVAEEFEATEAATEAHVMDETGASVLADFTEANTNTVAAVYDHDVSETVDVTVATTDSHVMAEAAAESFDATGAVAHTQVHNEAGAASHASTGYLDFSGTNKGQLSNPVGNNETDLPHPTTSMDLRLDIDLNSMPPAGRMVHSIHSDATGAGRAFMFRHDPSTASTAVYNMNSGSETDELSKASFWTTGRMQYRMVHSGTTVTFYRRDPATYDLPLADDSNWTQEAQNASATNISSMNNPANAAFTIYRRTNGGGMGVNSQWYESYIAIDGTVESTWGGGEVTLDNPGNEFVDEQAQDWDWNGATDPTQTAGDRGGSGTLHQEVFDVTVSNTNEVGVFDTVAEEFEATESHTEVQVHVEDVVEAFEPTESTAATQVHVEDVTALADFTEANTNEQLGTVTDNVAEVFDATESVAHTQVMEEHDNEYEGTYGDDYTGPSFDVLVSTVDFFGNVDNVAESFDVTEAASESQVHVEAVAESLDATESVAETQVHVESVAEEAQFTEAATESQISVEAVAESFDVTEAAVETQISVEAVAEEAQFAEAATDSLTLTESVAEEAQFTEASTDELVGSNEYNHNVSESFDVTVASTDAATSTDGVAESFDVTVSSTDAIVSSDSVSAVFDATVAGADALVATEGALAAFDATTVGSDALTGVELAVGTVEWTETAATTQAMIETGQFAEVLVLEDISDSHITPGVSDDKSDLLLLGHEKD